MATQTETEKGRTKGDAVGPSRTPSSSGEKGNRGTMMVRRGTMSNITTGNPMAARVCKFRVRKVDIIGLRQGAEHRNEVQSLTDGLCDRERDREADKLDSDKQQNARLADISQRVCACSKMAVLDQVEDLLCDSVACQCIGAHVPAGEKIMVNHEHFGMVMMIINLQ